MMRIASASLVLGALFLFGPFVNTSSAQQRPAVEGQIAPELREAMAQKEIVAAADQLKCIGFISPELLPRDLIVSGTREEGRATSLMEGSILYASGPAAKSVKAGETFRIVRPEGRILDQYTRNLIGYYYKELGTAEITDAGADTVIGRVQMSCRVMYKGDLLIPMANRQPVRFNKPLSTATTPIPEEGLAATIIFGKEDLREMAAGHFCFINAGARDGVKPGDRFTIYRPQAPFNPTDLIANPPPSATTYQKARTSRYEEEIIYSLKQRRLPHYVLGDLVVVDVAETTAAAKIVYSRTEVHPGDFAIRR
jgi:hypothetical protein